MVTYVRPERVTQIEPLIPSGKPHPLGCHNPRYAIAMR